MTDFLLGVLIFSSGGALGVILAAFFIVGRAADEPEEPFDGGFRANNAPPARTRIWHGSVEGRE